jgi:hypothetical protein
MLSVTPSLTRLRLHGLAGVGVGALDFTRLKQAPQPAEAASLTWFWRDSLGYRRH